MKLKWWDLLPGVFGLGSILAACLSPAMGQAICDQQCREILIYAEDLGGGQYICYNFAIPDCWVCGNPAVPTCSTQMMPGAGKCQTDLTRVQKRSQAGNCFLVCPLPPNGRTQAQAVAGMNFVDFGAPMICKKQ